LFYFEEYPAGVTNACGERKFVLLPGTKLIEDTEGAILFSAALDLMFNLNPTGVAIWRGLERWPSMETAELAMRKCCELAADDPVDGVGEFLVALERAGLLRLMPAGGTQ